MSSLLIFPRVYSLARSRHTLRMAIQRQLRLAQRLQRRTLLDPQFVVELRHQRRRRLVVHLPQRTDHVGTAGRVEGTLQAQHALAFRQFAQTRLAGAQHAQPQILQRQIDDVQAGENATVRVRLGRMRWPRRSTRPT